MKKNNILWYSFKIIYIIYCVPGCPLISVGAKKKIPSSSHPDVLTDVSLDKTLSTCVCGRLSKSIRVNI